MKRKKGFYSISVVAKMFSVHQQTIRMYEKEGLICPSRSSGNTRLFSEEDVNRLEEVINLTHKMGVNLAGVELILKLERKIKRMQDEINRMFSETQGQLLKETEGYKLEAKKQSGRLFEIRQENAESCKHRTIDVEAGHIVVPGGKQGKTTSKKDSAMQHGETSPKTTKEGRGGSGDESMIDDWKIDYEDSE